MTEQELDRLIEIRELVLEKLLDSAELHDLITGKIVEVCKQEQIDPDEILENMHSSDFLIAGE